MAGETITTTLGATVDLITGFPFKSDLFTVASTDTRLLRGDNVAQGYIRWSGAKRWAKPEEAEEYLLRPGDVIVAMDRPWIEAGLKCATLTATDCPSLLVQRVACLRARPGLDQGFLGYLIRSQAFTNYVLGVQTGTAVPHISGSQIRAFPFNMPPLQVQEAASALLGALDNKIELNGRMVETLEATARTLFKSWFIDFDPVHTKAEGRSTRLPDHIAQLFTSSIDDKGLPAGWTTQPLDQIVALARDTVDPSVLADEVVEHFSLPAYDGGSGPKVEPASAIKSLKLRLSAPSILFSKLNPDTPRVWPVLKQSFRPMLASTEFLAFHPAAADVPLSFIEGLLASSSFRDKAAGMVTGTSKSHQRVQPKALLGTEWVVPPAPVLAAFDTLVGVSLTRRAALRDESDALNALRVTLLPKLISGELRIHDAERTVGAVA